VYRVSDDRVYELSKAIIDDEFELIDIPTVLPVEQ
jgi:hypothetical protein